MRAWLCCAAHWHTWNQPGSRAFVRTMAATSHISRPTRALIKVALLLPAAILVSCSGADVTTPGSAAEDDQAIAAVEAAQKRIPAAVFVTLQPISASNDLPCAFNVPASVKPPVFRFGPGAGTVMIDGIVKAFSADSGSIEIYPGVRQQYDGKEFSVYIQLDADDPANRGNANYWPAKLTMSDRYERTVFFGVGMVTCGAQARRTVAASLSAPGSDQSPQTAPPPTRPD